MLGDSDVPWSPSITVIYPGTPELFVPIPMPAERTTTAFSDGKDVPHTADAAIEKQSSLVTAGHSKALLRRSTVIRHEHEQELAVVLRVSMQVHSPGCLHVILHTVGCQAPYLLQNRTDVAFVYRQHNTPDKWRLLPAYSSVGYVWGYVDGAWLPRCELVPASGRSSSNLNARLSV